MRNWPPTLKRWAILRSPSGTEGSFLLPESQDIPNGYYLALHPAPNECGGRAGFLTASLDLGKPKDGFIEKALGFVQIRVYLVNPGFAPEEVATGLGAQEPPAGLLELFAQERRVHVVSSNF